MKRGVFLTRLHAAQDPRDAFISALVGATVMNLQLLIMRIIYI